MTVVGKRLMDIRASLNRSVSFWASCVALFAFLFGAYQANATDKEVRLAVAQVKTQVLSEQKVGLAQVLKSLEALEMRIVNGDLLLRMEFVLSELARLKDKRRITPTSELGALNDEIKKRERQLDAIMDQMRVAPF